MKGDSIACQNLSLEYKALASRPLSSKDPTINERQYRIAKEIMDIANYLSKSASLIESCEHKQSAWKPGKVNLIKYTNLNLTLPSCNSDSPNSKFTIYKCIAVCQMICL